MRMKLSASEQAQAAIVRLGRTEDVAFSPDNSSLAIVGHFTNRILILAIATRLDREEVVADDFLEITSKAFNLPHGIAWLDQRTLIVANRAGEAPLISLPASWPDSRHVAAVPIRALKANVADLLNAPGSVAVRRLGHDLHEVLLCNNNANNVTRHVLDGRAAFQRLSSEILVTDGLDVPDSVACSANGSWIAVSNHYANCVFIYHNDGRLGPQSKPDGILRGVNYPHGVRFSSDGQFLLVANAGAPFVHIYRSDGDWSGERLPIHDLQVFDDEAFRRGNINPEEGGPKGLALSNDNAVLVASCEEEPIEFFDVRELLGRFSRNVTAERQTLSDTEAMRDLAIRSLTAGQRNAHALRDMIAANETERLSAVLAERDLARSAAQQNAASASAEAARANVAEASVNALLASTSWRLTAPLRWLRRLAGGP